MSIEPTTHQLSVLEKEKLCIVIFLQEISLRKEIFHQAMQMQKLSVSKKIFIM
jgi:hypothetical protein